MASFILNSVENFLSGSEVFLEVVLFHIPGYQEIIEETM